MSASYNGNSGNSGNSGNNGNAGSASGVPFFADRVNLPFVMLTNALTTEPPTPIGRLAAIGVPRFPDRSWSVEWRSWAALTEFAQADWLNLTPWNEAGWPSWVPQSLPQTGGLPDWSALNATASVQGEINQLVTAAAEERADALGEIVSQSGEFISYFMNLLSARPASHPATAAALGIASLTGTFVSMHFKRMFARPRPSQLCPALLPPLEVPGHASFPSGHSTQAHLMALCLQDVLGAGADTALDNAWTLAGRIARNREIAGLHYPSDTQAGIAVARSAKTLLGGAGQATYQRAVAVAAQEWS